jgi:hypothetical protein
MHKRLFQQRMDSHSGFNISATLMSTALLFIFAFSFSINAQESDDQALEEDNAAPLKEALSLVTHDTVNDLNYYLPGDQLSVLPLNVNGQQIEVPIIKYRARQAIVKGVTILIGEIQAQGQVDSSLNALAKSLPDWGWHTILITPSPSYLVSKPKETEATETVVSSTNKTVNTNTAVDDNQLPLVAQVDLKPTAFQAPSLPYTHSDYLMFMNALTKAINSRFSQQPGYKLVYANGKSAAALIPLLNLPDSLKIDALVVNNIYWPANEQNQALAGELANLPMPALDLISLSDNSWAKQTANARAIAAKVNLKPLYRQQEIIGGTKGLTQQNYLAKEVVSWTYFLGW